MDERARFERGALSRQPICHSCLCEEHIVFGCECGCPPHLPIGIYAT